MRYEGVKGQEKTYSLLLLSKSNPTHSALLRQCSLHKTSVFAPVICVAPYANVSLSSMNVSTQAEIKLVVYVYFTEISFSYHR